MRKQILQESTFRLKMEQQRELLQKEIQAKEKETAHLKELILRQDERIAGIDRHTSRFGVSLSIFAILITLVLGGLALLAYYNVTNQVREQAKSWFDENAEELQAQIVELKKDAATAKSAMDRALSKVKEHELKVRNEFEKAKDRLQLAVNDKLPVKDEDKQLIEEETAQLKDKPESSYSYEDWNTLALNAWSNDRFELAADYWERAASVPSANLVDRARALFQQGLAFGELGRSDDEIAVYDRLIRDYDSDEEPALREQVAKAMINKGVTLGELGRGDDAIAVYDRVIEVYGDDKEPALRELVAKAMFNKGVRLGELGRSADAIAVYDRLIRDYDSDEEPALREQVAKAMFNKGVRLGELGRSDDEIAVYDRLIRDYDSDEEPALREQVVKAMFSKGVTLEELERSDDAIAVYDRLIRDYGSDGTDAMVRLVEKAKKYKRELEQAGHSKKED